MLTQIILEAVSNIVEEGVDASRPGSGETAGFPSVAEPGEFGVDKDDDFEACGASFGDSCID